jgi:hypothetical protein
LSSAGAVDNLNLYVYVGNNPLKYRDPTGHVKETPEQEAMEKGAVGGVSDIMTGLEESSAPRSLKISHCKISCCIFFI